MSDHRDALLVAFRTLFRGNPDAWGAERGAAVREQPPWREHLFGRTPMGIYPAHNGRVGWGCIDLDVSAPHHPAGDYESEDAAGIAAASLVVALDAFGITSWTEVTRSRGRHVWTFSRAPVSARVMRRALLVACQIAEVKATECNPKSEELPDGSLGNYVRLPYPAKNEGTTERHVYVYPTGEVLSVSTFTSRALQARNVPELYEAAAELWVPPQPAVRFTPVKLPELGQKSIYDRLSPAGRMVLAEGPMEGGDRSNALVRLAVYCREAGLEPIEALEIVRDGDARWGKFAGRPDCDRRLRAIVDAAWR